MLAVDFAVLEFFSHRKGLLAWWGAMTCAGVAAVALGGLDGCFEDHFGIFRLWAYGVFFHGVALLAATAFMWRHHHRLLAGAAALGAIAIVLIAVDAFLIEPHWLEVCHYEIASPKIHRPLRIVVVADFQTNAIGPYEVGVLRRALEEKPDIILLAGDYLQVPDNDASPLIWAICN
jgi:uncharacterized protein